MTTSSATIKKLSRYRVSWSSGKWHVTTVLILTEASIDLASREELLEAMVDANFITVFIGIETPSAEALRSRTVSESAQE